MVPWRAQVETVAFIASGPLNEWINSPASLPVISHAGDSAVGDSAIWPYHQFASIRIDLP
jgi:hypothetical protein